MATWTNIEILGNPEVPPAQEQTDTEWPKMSYIQRLLTWVRVRVRRLLGKDEVVEKKPDCSTSSNPREYLYDVHEVDLPVRI